MRRLVRIYTLLLLLVTACSPISATNTSPAPIGTSTAKPNPSLVLTATSPPAATIAITSTAKLTPEPAPTSVRIEPQIEARCPPQPEVSLADLGMPSTSRLIFVPPGQSFPGTNWSVVGSDLKVSRIPVSNKPTAWMGVSRDQHWFAFYAKGDIGNDLWISSIDGSTQWRALKNVEKTHSVDWVNAETIIVYDGLFGYNWLITSKRLHPMTLEISPLPVIYLEFNIFAFNPDASQVIYLDRVLPYSWKRYDFQTNAVETVFPWMDTSPLRLPFDASVTWTRNGASVAMTGLADVVELAINLPSTTLGQRDVPVWKIMMPGKGSYSRVVWWSSDGQFIGILQSFGDKGGPSASTQFYILDTARWVLYDYCLPKDMNPRGIFTSPDGRLLAWPINYHSQRLNRFVGSVVLELATGRRALLNDMLVFGWGEVNR